MGGAGTDSTPRKEATMSPPNATACNPRANGKVIILRVRRRFFVENTIESNKCFTSSGRLGTSGASRPAGLRRLLLRHDLLAHVQGLTHVLVGFPVEFHKIVVIAHQLRDLGFLAIHEVDI